MPTTRGARASSSSSVQSASLMRGDVVRVHADRREDVRLRRRQRDRLARGRSPPPDPMQTKAVTPAPRARASTSARSCAEVLGIQVTM